MNKVNILIVDDDPQTLIALEAILRNLNQKLITCLSGKEAVKKVSEEDFAVIILDVNMPVMDGFRTMQLIRENEKSKDIPIILLTASFLDSASIAKGYSGGAVDYLMKPIQPEMLRTKVEFVTRLALQKLDLKILNQELEKKTVELEIINNELQAFNSMVAHDLRNPLRGIGVLASFMLERESHALTDSHRHYLDEIKKSGKRMEELTEDLLRLSQTSNSELDRHSLDLADIARPIADELKRSDQDRKVEFIIQESIPARGDMTLLRIALENLMGNAWKYTSSHLEARIEFGFFEDKEKGMVYFIKDDGVGFDMASAGKLFTPFTRIHSETNFAGIGIGLVTVQKIIRRHGGVIWAQAERDMGATFYFTLKEY